MDGWDAKMIFPIICFLNFNNIKLTFLYVSMSIFVTKFSLLCHEIRVAIWVVLFLLLILQYDHLICRYTYLKHLLQLNLKV